MILHRTSDIEYIAYMTQQNDAKGISPRAPQRIFPVSAASENVSTCLQK